MCSFYPIIFKIILVAYIYGVDKFLSNIAEMKMNLSRVTTLYWKVGPPNINLHLSKYQSTTYMIFDSR